MTITARAPGHPGASPGGDSVSGAIPQPAAAGCAPAGSAAALAGKRCPCCGETKALGEFHRNKASRDGLAYYCKPCACAVVRDWRAAYPERRRASQKAWREANPERARAIYRRSKAAWTARQRAEREAHQAERMARAQEAARP